MNDLISGKMQSVKASAIREILKATSNPDIISFAGGNPAPETFPVEAIREISDRILSENPYSVLQYGITEGDSDFLKQANIFFNRNEQVTKDNDMIISATGSQQIMDLLSKTLCNEGDIIVSEEPAFLGALNCFKENGALLRGVGFKNEQLDLEALEKAFASSPKPKFFYTIPNFQNPMGTTMSLEVRRQVLALAKKYQIIILEDNPYGAIRFTDQAIPSIKSLDQDDLVIYAASLSKIMAPGMRLAVCIGRKDIVGKMVVAKQGADVHTNLWAQKVSAKLLETYDMDKHLKYLREVYQKKCELMLKTMDQAFNQRVTYTRPKGGMFIWVTMPDHIDVNEFVQKALKHRVAIVPGASFYIDDSLPCHSFRMNFSTPSDENIIKGVRILAKLMKDIF